MFKAINKEYHQKERLYSKSKELMIYFIRFICNCYKILYFPFFLYLGFIKRDRIVIEDQREKQMKESLFSHNICK